MRTAKIISIFILGLWYSSSDALMTVNLEKAIVLVRSGSKYSTGFFWKNGSTVVTTLHSISNSGDIDIYLPSTTTWIKKVSLKKVHKFSDLAMLEVKGYASPDYLTERCYSRPPFHTKCFTVGYNSGNPYYISREFTVGISEKSNLSGILPNTLWTSVSSWGFLNLETEIVYLEGQLLHGFSGSPVVDSQGKLIGIADGGLENGAAGISWCVKANYLPALENSMEALSVLNQGIIGTLFSGEDLTKDEKSGKPLELNGFRFRKVKTRTFAQMDMTGKYSTMDALGLSQLLYNFSMFNYSSFEYAVYMEENSGATIVLPADNELKAESGLIVSGNDKIRMYLKVTKTTDVQQASLQFEGAIMPYYNTNWIADLAWTYPNVYPGANNSYVRRRAYFGNNNRNYLFEALAGNQTWFLGAAVKKDNSLMAPGDYEEWAKYVIAIQLTTFTN